LTPVAGDPWAIADAARTFESIAAEVAAAATKLRALGSGEASWAGKAATSASARAAILPPKLDKVRASYAAAGAALRCYAAVLAAAQRQSASAVRVATRAAEELQAARATQCVAAARDVEQARAAAAAGQPAPAPTAPRCQADIDEAAHKLSRATADNAAAHDDLDRAAKRAADELLHASREGIQNKKWWHRLVSDVAHWTETAWTSSLRLISKAATTISALAGLAALALAVAGIFFPPLEAAAAILESVSAASGAIGAIADIALAATEKSSWSVLAIDGLGLVPVGGSVVLRKATPFLRETKVGKTVTRVLSPASKSPDATATAATRILERPASAYPEIAGKGARTRKINYRPRNADARWGLTKQHLEKHLFGEGPNSLSVIDPAGNADIWKTYIQELAGRAPTATRSGGVEDIIGTFAKADGSGSFRLGIRVARGLDDSFDLVTLLTRQ